MVPTRGTFLTQEIPSKKQAFKDSHNNHHIINLNSKLGIKSVFPFSDFRVLSQSSIKVFSPSILGFSDPRDIRTLHNGILPCDGLSPDGLIVMETIVVGDVPMLNVEKVIASSTTKSSKPDTSPTSMRLET